MSDIEEVPSRTLAVLILSLLALVAAPSGAGAVERPFAPSSFWNRPLPANAPLDRHSDALVTDLVQQVERYGPWINTWQYSSPVYRVGRGAPRVPVRLDTAFGPLERAFASVPVPPGAVPARGGDAHMVVWQPATDTMWEFWKMQLREDGWHARWGGRMRAQRVPD